MGFGVYLVGGRNDEGLLGPVLLGLDFIDCDFVSYKLLLRRDDELVLVYLH